jgi:hypothetical protein
MSNIQVLVENARSAGFKLSLSENDTRVTVDGGSLDHPLIVPLVARKPDVLKYLIQERGGRKPEYFKAIATTYRQFEFRSRLEAKWAAFFDLCKWTWSYEPVDCNGWIPDFAIGNRPTVVECKPFFKYAEWADAIQKIFDAKYELPVVLLGADPVWVSVEAVKDTPGCVWSETPTDAPIVGWLLFNESVFHLHFGLTEDGRGLGLCPMDGPWINFIHGNGKLSHTAKSDRVFLRGSSVETELVERWATACNISKWVPTRGQNVARS